MSRPSTSGNFWTDISRLLGFLWKKRKSRKEKGDGKVMKRLKREFYK